MVVHSGGGPLIYCVACGVTLAYEDAAPKVVEEGFCGFVCRGGCKQPASFVALQRRNYRPRRAEEDT